MKKLSFLIIVLFFSYCGFSQSLTGLWNGTFTNDSTTLRADQPFEIALTEYKGKVYGYSRREFIKNDTLYYVLKRVKGKIDGDICEVTEDEYISHNFPYIDKGVKITYTFHFNKKDSSWSLDGRWKTNQVVRRKTGYYALTGNVGMATQKDLSKSKLFPHLAELRLDNDVPFYVAYKKQEAIEEEQKKIAASKGESEKKQADIAKANTEVNKPKEQLKQEPVTAPSGIAKTNSEPEKKKEETTIIKNETTVAPKKDVAKTTLENKPKEQPNQGPVVTPPGIAKTNEAEKKREDIAVKKETTVPAAKQDIAKATVDNTKPTEQLKQQPVVPSKEVAKTTIEPEKKKEDIAVKKEDLVVASDIAVNKSKTDLPKPIAAVNVDKRRSETIQAIEFQSDSITLALYDNGEIDGDTISILINGEVIIPKQGLKASAFKKTIYITPAMQDSFSLVLYAENLGAYPPNTGLIVVRDGEKSYQVRFSADLQKNVAVLFRRKKSY